MTFKEAKAELNSLGCTLVKKDGEYRVRLKGSPVGFGHFTTDLIDAVKTGQLIAIAATPPEPSGAAPMILFQWLKKGQELNQERSIEYQETEKQFAAIYNSTSQQRFIKTSRETIGALAAWCRENLNIN